MIRLYCDKCGAECDGSRHIKVHEPNYDTVLHLCAKCHKALRRWLRKDDRG